jgi:hypothetical protein
VRRKEIGGKYISHIIGNTISFERDPKAFSVRLSNADSDNLRPVYLSFMSKRN